MGWVFSSTKYQSPKPDGIIKNLAQRIRVSAYKNLLNFADVLNEWNKVVKIKQIKRA